MNEWKNFPVFCRPELALPHYIEFISNVTMYKSSDRPLWHPKFFSNGPYWAFGVFTDVLNMFQCPFSVWVCPRGIFWSDSVNLSATLMTASRWPQNWPQAFITISLSCFRPLNVLAILTLSSMLQLDLLVYYLTMPLTEEL